VHLQDTTVEDVFLLASLLHNHLAVIDEPLDDLEVVEGVVLEMVLVVGLVLLHQPAQIVIDLQEDLYQALLVHLLRKVLLQDLTRYLQYRLGRELTNPSIDRLLLKIVVSFHESFGSALVGVKQKLQISTRKRREITDNFIVTLTEFLIVYLLVSTHRIKGEFAILRIDQTLDWKMVTDLLEKGQQPKVGSQVQGNDNDLLLPPLVGNLQQGEVPIRYLLLLHRTVLDDLFVGQVTADTQDGLATHSSVPDQIVVASVPFEHPEKFDDLEQNEFGDVVLVL
jgi:hypothetical protein